MSMHIERYKLNGVTFEPKGEGALCTIDQGGVCCTYPIAPVTPSKDIRYVLMDLDGTTVKSEEFWITLIEKTVQTLLKDDSFRLEEEDIPFVSGFSTIAHLDYCIQKYHIDCETLAANEIYHKIAEFELNEILEGRGDISNFHPRPGLKEFMFGLKKKGIKIGLATSGLEYKAIPEVLATFKLLDMGNPLEFYDSIVMGGKRKTKGLYGSIGELAAKPHPWVYAELGIGLNITDKSQVLVLEDSSSGVISARAAGYPVIGFKDGNLLQSGLDDLCYKMVDSFEDIDL